MERGCPSSGGGTRIAGTNDKNKQTSGGCIDRASFTQHTLHRVMGAAYYYTESKCGSVMLTQAKAYDYIRLFTVWHRELPLINWCPVLWYRKIGAIRGNSHGNMRGIDIVV